MAVLQLSRRGFLLHEAVGMCCTLCDNVGRERIDEHGVNFWGLCRTEGPRIGKVSSILPGQGDPGVNCIMSLPRHRGEVQAGEEGLQKGSSPSSGGSVHFKRLEDFNWSWKDIVNLIAMMCNKLILMKGNVIPRS